jgi:hypothetical protein
MTSVTYGMPKSLCKVTFDTYQGALASFLNVLDWNVWRIFVLEGLLHPHSSIPQVQTGFIIALYMVILFPRDSCDFLFISQFIFLTLSSNCLLLAFICICHVIFLSRWSPRYLTSCLNGMRKLLILTCSKLTCSKCHLCGFCWINCDFPLLHPILK